MSANERATAVLGLYGFNRRPELGKICRYIELTDVECLKRGMYSDDLKTLFLLGKKSICECIILSYLYGQAKGYRTRDQRRIGYDKRIGSKERAVHGSGPDCGEG